MYFQGNATEKLNNPDDENYSLEEESSDGHKKKKKTPEKAHLRLVEQVEGQQDLEKLEQIIKTRKRIGTVAKWLDKYKLDALLGLLVGGGDVATALAGSYIVLESMKCGLPKKEIVKMIIKITLDLLMGVIPVAGDIADFFYKSNQKNVHIFDEWLRKKYIPELEAKGVPVPKALTEMLNK